MIQNFGWFLIKTMWATRLLGLHQSGLALMVVTTIVWCLTSWCIDEIGEQIVIHFKLDELIDKNTSDHDADDKDEKQ